VVDYRKDYFSSYLPFRRFADCLRADSHSHVYSDGRSVDVLAAGFPKKFDGELFNFGFDDFSHSSRRRTGEAGGHLFVIF
jgi:hypothetical protein